MLSMHELSLSMPEPMLSPSMLILTKTRFKSWLTKLLVRSGNAKFVPNVSTAADFSMKPGPSEY